MDVESNNASGIKRPSILLIVLFWHHILFLIVAIWCSIGIVVVPDTRHLLVCVITMSAVQIVCAFSGLIGAKRQNTKYIYYFSASQGLLAGMELFWAVMSLFNYSIFTFVMLILFCIYQVFLVILSYRYSKKMCDPSLLKYIWPFNSDVHPNHLPSAADRINEQSAPYGTFDETHMKRKVDSMHSLENFNKKTPVDVDSHKLSRFSIGPPPDAQPKKSKEEGAKDNAEKSSEKNTVNNKSVHPASSDLSTIASSTKSHTPVPLQQRTTATAATMTAISVGVKTPKANKNNDQSMASGDNSNASSRTSSQNASPPNINQKKLEAENLSQSLMSKIFGAPSATPKKDQNISDREMNRSSKDRKQDIEIPLSPPPSDENS